MARLRHLRTLLHPGLLCSLHHGGNSSDGVPEDSQSVRAAEDGPQPAVRGLESDSDYMGVDVCLHLCLLPRHVSQVARDHMWPVRVVSDISGLVSKTFVSWTPASASSTRTETTRIGCRHTFLRDIVAIVAAFPKTTHYTYVTYWSLDPSCLCYFKLFPPCRKVILFRISGVRFVHSVWQLLFPK